MLQTDSYNLQNSQKAIKYSLYILFQSMKIQLNNFQNQNSKCIYDYYINSFNETNMEMSERKILTLKYMMKRPP